MQQAQMKKTLDDWLQTPGLSGHEGEMAEKVMAAFTAAGAEVWQDELMNVYAAVGPKQGRPLVMVSAHMDEIGMMVDRIDEDGFIFFSQIGGIDPRILPAQEVIVEGKKPLYGIIGLKPPHVTTVQERKKVLPINELAIDVGLDAEQVRALISPGDRIHFDAPLHELSGRTVAGHTLDDRAGVLAMLEACLALREEKLSCRMVFVASVQEEVGTRGAKVAAYGLQPDIAIAIDVTHGKTPDAPADLVFPLKNIVLAVGPNIHPKLVKEAQRIARQEKIDYEIEVEAHVTGTDADPLQISRTGIPTMLIELPLKYMHTTVETLDLKTVKDSAKLLRAIATALGKGWEAKLCF
ncbi:M42 family metallopeptidase [Luoshenia tenuis]|uniref:M42 family metallopeptidase n=1 Tax=Luoshenia tenuis TaxID=2763654 RepID=UPI003D8B80EC